MNVHVLQKIPECANNLCAFPCDPLGSIEINILLLLLVATLYLLWHFAFLLQLGSFSSTTVLLVLAWPMIMGVFH